MNPVVILAAAAFTGATSLSAGLLAFHGLKIRLHRNEIVPLAYVTGSAILSTLIFLLCALRIAWTPVFALVSAALMAATVWRKAWRIDDGQTPPSIPKLWRWLLIAAFAAYGVFALAHALAPETSPDGTAYHLGTVGRYFRNGGFDWYTTNFYASLPMGVEMLFLHAYAFGRHSAAALIHWQFLMVLPWLILNLGRRCSVPIAGAIAALLTFMSPIVLIDGASAYVDVAMAATAFSVFYVALLVGNASASAGLQPVLGLLAGWVYACKMTGFTAVLFALGYVAITMRRLRPIIVVGLFAAITLTPWLVKNAVIVGNPFSPFLNRVFPNPYVTIQFEDEYTTAHRTYYGAVPHSTEIPLEVTARGGKLNGILGPVFLLAPLALVALRWPLGRRALAAAGVFLLTYPGNIGTRFLIIALPFVSLAMGLTLSQWRGTALAVVLFHGVFSWPGAVQSFAHESVWRLDRFRWQAALRLESEDGFLTRYVPYYEMAKLVEKHVPPGGQVLTFGNVAESYTSREVRVIYESAANNIAGETLAAGAGETYQPTLVWEFRFDPRQVQRVRLVQTKSAPEPWNVNELRAYASAGVELPRDDRWHVRAHPFPWIVQYAFDNSPLTRWRTWEPAAPGQWIEMDFGRLCELSMVRAELSPDQRTSARLEVETAPGKWETIVAEPAVSHQPPVVNSRLMATDELKRQGITHLSISNDDLFSEDLYRNQKAWGITFLGEASSGRLYRLD